MIRGLGNPIVGGFLHLEKGANKKKKNQRMARLDLLYWSPKARSPFWRGCLSHPAKTHFRPLLNSA